MPILFMLIMLVLIWFGFHLLAAIITGVAPGAAFLFHDNGIATFIFFFIIVYGLSTRGLRAYRHYSRVHLR